MAIASKNTKSAKSAGSKIVSSKKKRLSRKQWGIIAIVTALVIIVGGYFGIQYYQNSVSNADSCVSQTFKKGSSKSNCVKYAQQVIGIKADGVFGTNTYNAVKSFQTKYKVSSTGTLDAKTWTKICMVAAKGSGLLIDAYRHLGCTTNGYNFKNVFIKSGVIRIYACKHSDTMISLGAQNYSPKTMYNVSVHGGQTGWHIADSLAPGKSNTLFSGMQSYNPKTVSYMPAKSGLENTVGTFNMNISTLPSCY